MSTVLSILDDCESKVTLFLQRSVLRNVRNPLEWLVAGDTKLNLVDRGTDRGLVVPPAVTPADGL
jgi:hypothetical protein